MKRLLTFAAGLALAFATVTVSGADPLKVGFVYIGPISDYGWNYEHNQGRLAVEAALGDQVETVYVENVPEGPDAEPTITRLAQDGASLIFTTSFGYMEPTLKVAKRFPDVRFEHATGYKRADNVSTYSARFYEGRYVNGQIAARMSKIGVAGYIASFPIPEVVSGINAFMLGAQSIDPDFKVKIVWVNTWFDPGKEADAAKVLMDQGADVLSQHTNSIAPLQVAAERGVLGFGQGSDMIAFAPNNQLTAIINNWGPYYVARTKAVICDTWESKDTWGGMDLGVVKMAAYTNLPDDVAAMAKETQARITSGEMHVFAGPIHKQDGTMVIGEGEHLDDGTLLGMDWYVQGVDDTLPQ